MGSSSNGRTSDSNTDYEGSIPSFPAEDELGGAELRLESGRRLRAWESGSPSSSNGEQTSQGLGRSGKPCAPSGVRFEYDVLLNGRLTGQGAGPVSKTVRALGRGEHVLSLPQMESKLTRRSARFAKPTAPSGVRFKYGALLNDPVAKRLGAGLQNR
jgi:hypothetical protein